MGDGLQLDFNLQGMGHIHLSSVRFRGPLPPAVGQQLPATGTTCDRWRAEWLTHGVEPAAGALAVSEDSQALGAGGSASTSSSQAGPAVLWTEVSVPESWRWSSSGTPTRGYESYAH